MSQWDSYPCSVRDCSRAGECHGAGIYGIDGNTYAITEGMPAISPGDMKRTINYVKNKDYEKGLGLEVGGMKFTYIKHLEDSDTQVFKRKAKHDENGYEIEKIPLRDMYKLFIQLANTVAMIALYKEHEGMDTANHAEGLVRMNELIDYLKKQNM